MANDLKIATSEPLPAPAGDADPLLGSKFVVPSPPRFMVPRQRLWDHLSRDIGQPVTVVTGPAGSGKTQLLASWVRAGRSTDTVVWITLEHEDSGPAAFWAYVVEGLRRAGLSLFPSVAHPVPTAAVDQSFLTRLAAELAGIPQSVILVLDEVSTMTDPQWAVDLEFVLRHACGRLRLVLVGRWDPPLPLYRYRLHGTLSEIRGSDLAFTAAETVELLALHGLSLTDSALASLLRHTEGWAAGLRLFAMALEGRSDADDLVATITGDEATIAEYLMGEVLRSQPPPVREFLLKTSIVDTLNAELAEALTGRTDARRVLAGLERGNAFLDPVQTRPGTYRYHPLFAELLRAELAYGSPGSSRELHRRAARWFLGDGNIVEAIVHATRAGDWAAAAAIAVDDLAIGQLVLGRDRDRLVAAFRGMPDDVEDPGCALVTAALALGGDDPLRCVAHLARADDLLAHQDLLAHRPPDRVALALAAAVLETLVARAAHDAPRVLYAARAAQSLVGESPVERVDRHPEMLALVLAAVGTAHNWMGAIDEAAAAFSQGVAAAAARGCEYPRMDCLQQLALIRAYQGQLRHAEALANQALAAAEQAGVAPGHQPVVAEVAQAWVAMERYDVDAAWGHLRIAEPLCGPLAEVLPAAGFAIVKSRLMRARGEIRGALQILTEAGTALSGQGMPVWLDREIALGQARLLTAMGRPVKALTIIDKLREPETPEVDVVLAGVLLATGDAAGARQTAERVTSSSHVGTPVAVDAWLTLATLAVDGGDVRRAREALRHALRLADRDSQRRSFHEIGAALRRVLRDDQDLAGQYRALGRWGPGAHPHEGASPEAPVDPVIVDSLSTRELEVLGYLAAMWPTEEIAATMYLSVNTVKTHIRSILRKLSASRRNEAVRRARSLGLI